jgi:hypothetical protein
MAPIGLQGVPAGAGDRDASRARALAMLAAPKATGLPEDELQKLCAELAPAQAAMAEQRKYLQRGGARRKERRDHGRPLLAPADRVLITVATCGGCAPRKSWSNCWESIRTPSARQSGKFHPGQQHFRCNRRYARQTPGTDDIESVPNDLDSPALSRRGHSTPV